MERGRAVRLAVLLVSLGRVVVAADEPRPPVRPLLVKVWDRAPVPIHEWRRTTVMVDELMGAAGLRVSWQTCGLEDPPDCSCPQGPGEIGLRLLRRTPAEARATGHFTGGAALATDRGSARGIAYVFYDRLAAFAAEAGVDAPVVLAVTVAHEIGHLLISAGHARAGIMQANPSLRDWQNAGRGWLRFSPGESRLLVERLRGPSVAARYGGDPTDPVVWTGNGH